MKKTFALLLALLMLLTLVACGPKTGDRPGTGEEIKDDTAPVADSGSDAPGEDIIEPEPDDQQSDDQQPDDQQEDGTGSAETVEWGLVFADPKLYNKNNMTDEQIRLLEEDARENNYTVRWDEEGYLIIEEDGHVFDFSGKWPENELTRNVPAPDEDAVITSGEEDGAFVANMHWTIDEAKEYTAKLKNAGYDKDVTEMSGAIYLFMANNGEYTVTVSVTDDYDTAEYNGALIISSR